MEGPSKFASRANKAPRAMRPGGGDRNAQDTRLVTSPATPVAAQWQGWGTALKPAHEQIILARLPLDGTILQNCCRYGSGALNIDGCRVGTDDSLGGGATKAETVCATNHEGWDRPWKHNEESREAHASRVRENVEKAEELGRWPANVYHDGSEEVVGQFPETGGGKFTVGGPPRTATSHLNQISGQSRDESIMNYGDSGSASRFFCQADWSLEISEQTASASFIYQAKAGKKERRAGLDGLCSHPTLKPISLTEHLAKLLVPPPAYAPRRMFVPFSGVASEVIGAFRAGWEDIVGVELEKGYVEEGKMRVAHWTGVKMSGTKKPDKGKTVATIDLMDIFGEEDE